MVMVLRSAVRCIGGASDNTLGRSQARLEWHCRGGVSSRGDGERMMRSMQAHVAFWTRCNVARPVLGLGRRRLLPNAFRLR
jgi:hypothetical protein